MTTRLFDAKRTTRATSRGMIKRGHSYDRKCVGPRMYYTRTHQRTHARTYVPIHTYDSYNIQRQRARHSCATERAVLGIILGARESHMRSSYRCRRDANKREVLVFLPSQIEAMLNACNLPESILRGGGGTETQRLG